MANKQIYDTKWNRFRAKAYAKVFLPIESCEKMRTFSKGIIRSNYCKKGYPGFLWHSGHVDDETKWQKAVASLEWHQISWQASTQE
jgi:hypothetical protein